MLRRTIILSVFAYYLYSISRASLVGGDLDLEAALNGDEFDIYRLYLFAPALDLTFYKLFIV